MRYRQILLGLLMAGLALMLVLVLHAERGENWVGRFYNCDDLDCDEVEREDYPDGLNFDWGTGKPEDADGNTLDDVDDDDFSARFDTTERFDPGTYEFVLSSSDGARLIINGVTVIDEFVNRSLTTDSVLVIMPDGDSDLRVEYFDDTGDAILRLDWFFESSDTSNADYDASSGTVGGTPVPTATPTPIPIIYGSVSTAVRGLSIRTGPYLGASLVGVARPENSYQVLGRNDSEGQYTWYQIQFSGGSGWVSGRYFQPDTESVPALTSVFDTLDAAPDTGVTGATRAIMNFRVRPSERAARIAQIPWGDPIQILNRTVQGGRDQWYQVRWNEQVGWIFAPYVRVDGDISRVPVR